MRAIILTLLAVTLIGGAGRYWQHAGKPDAAMSGRADGNASASAGDAESADADSGVGVSAEGASPNADGRVPDDENLAGAGGSEAGRDTNADDDRRAKKTARSAPSTFYQWVDDRGSVHFAASLDEVPASWRARAGQVALDAAVINRTDAPSAKPVRPRPVVEVAAINRAHDVTVYTAPWCGWCRKTIAFLDAHRVDYVNKDIDADEGYAAELREKSGSSAIPYVEIDGNPIRGFNPGQMTALLEN